ncbi:aspartate ammonia-lyase [Erythrobacter crassostreae]|uniref:Aspartate ammonia-lyase n=1 Tax=Erythrobacter crassostreae TaxID=2828328 RepID=A0A9X1JJK3_9SPHN|nr:aspartate ammonia-lyase [Erythrobacter crassostrea]MBV7257966.1 aspartate ammonia-lyase [Erythrobacter crassostrea]
MAKHTHIRLECDFLGEISLPASAYYGVETARALQNFPITGIAIKQMPELITALAWIKKAAARTNSSAGLLQDDVAAAIAQACDEILGGQMRDPFAVDVIQGGAGTSTNMNANEVIANRAGELLGDRPGSYKKVHPKDHVNMAQSTNDVYASAIRLTIVQRNQHLIDALRGCVAMFTKKADEFAHVHKIGRTQLQDAVPMTVGQEMRGYATALGEDIERLIEIESLFLEINMGGTAIGTSIGASEYYQTHIVQELARVSGLPVVSAADKIEASWDTGAFVLYSGVLKRIATKLSKIANDLRLLSSGPVGGFGELRLPRRQPGSSIMPGKVNPVIPEVVNQACFRIFGADTTVTFAAESGQLQLNAMEPVIIWSIYESSTALIAALETFAKNCIGGIEVDEQRCSALLSASTAQVTALSPIIGYAKAARVAEAMTDRSLTIEQALRETVPDQTETVLEELLR